MAKQKRDNSYYLERLEAEHPAIFSDWKAGKYRSIRKALEAAGLKKPPTQLNVLKNAWRKASAKEKRDFLAFVGVSTPSPVAASKPSVVTSPSALLDAQDHLLPAVATRIKAIMTGRRIKMGTVMSEMGFGSLDPSLGNAMSRARPTRVLPDKASALAKWLEANKGIP